ncbi:MAG: SPOR domain-containing protein [Azoarcus sp.]|nr:SPOR domain-containing protein [Azoarcus sp.]
MEHIPDAIPATSGETVQNSNANAVSGDPRLFLQLGVFASHINAETFRSRVSALVPELTANTETLPENGHFRIYTGPFASPADARAAAERIEEQMGIQPFIIRRD